MNVVPCEALWPGGDPAEAVLHWGFIAGRLGAAPLALLARPFLIGIRGAAPLARETRQAVHRPQYDDTFVLLVKGEAPLVFPGATHAYQLDSGLAPDADRDGRKDVGSIRPGRYLLEDRGIKPHPIFVLTTPEGKGEIPAYRDTDHDGVISEAEERTAREARASGAAAKAAQIGSDGYYATAVLLHTGFDAPANAAHRSSIACQTCSLKWLELLRKKAQPSRGFIDYVLANAPDVVAIAEERRKVLTPEPAEPGNVV
jgi:hypothetical protein